MAGIDGIGNSTSSQIETGQPGGEMGKEQFLQLLVTQMKNQDPMEPMDNTQMTAQLAQFSSLEQMQNLNSQFEGFQQSTTAAMSMMNAGKPVTLELVKGETVEGMLEKIQWIGGETQFVVEGNSYAASDVISMQSNVTQDPAAEIEK